MRHQIAARLPPNYSRRVLQLHGIASAQRYVDRAPRRAGCSTALVTWWIALVAFTLAGCEATLEPIQAPEQCPAPPIDDVPMEMAGVGGSSNTEDLALIDDFEATDGHRIPPIDGRDGAWVLGNDGTAMVPINESTKQCAARGQRAGHFAGDGFREWGANWTAVFRATPDTTAQVYDGSRYSGISFWAAVSPQIGSASVPLGITTIDVAWNGDVCNTCMDYYRTVREFDSVWRHYVVRFDELKQAGVGDPLLPLRKDQLVGFIFWPESPFDLWIDDMRFEE
jgi:hypothetical protein